MMLPLMDIFLHQHVSTYEICPVSSTIQSVFVQLGAKRDSMDALTAKT